MNYSSSGTEEKSLELSSKERGEMLEIAVGSNYDDVAELLDSRGPITLTGEEDVGMVRDLAALALETNVPENYGFETVEGVYNRGNEELFGQ